MIARRQSRRRGVVVAGLAVAATLTAASGRAAGQPALNVTFGRALNALSSADAVMADDRRTTGGAIEAEQKLAADRLRLFYSLDAGDYTTPGDWHYFENLAGATWQIRPQRSSGPAIFAGADMLWRTNGSSWEAANYRALGLFLNAEWKRGETRTLRTGYRADVRAFSDMPELDQVEHEGFGSVLVNLQSRTTLVAEVRAGAKLYEVIEWAALPTDAPTSEIPVGTERSRGHGAGSRGAVASTPAAQAGASVGGAAGQVTVLGRIAQSLTDRTGVTLQYSLRNSFGALPTAVVTTPALFFDDGVYDDPFASDAGALRVSLKHLLANGMTVGGSGVRVRKDYRGTLALDPGGLPLPSGELRADRIWQTGAAWTMPLLGERTGQVGLALVIDYQYTRHRSNDAFYNYSSHAVGFAVSVAY
jgi:hypothetical protein